MKRKFEKELENWKSKDITMPLMVVGARQIGKTYLINEFCEKNFKDYIYINLIDNKDIVEIFESNINTELKLERLEFYLNRKMQKDTVIFVDEVQESEGFICSLKYMRESDFPYNIICAGSLLGVKLRRFSQSFPVGKVNIKYMHPLDFEEFLMATNNDLLIENIRKCYTDNISMLNPMHEKALNLYRLYLCVGGMPASVCNLIENNMDILLYDTSILSSIIDSYIADMKKYTNNYFETVKIEKTYKSLPVQLGKENKKFMFSQIEKNARKRDFDSAIDWLTSSSLAQNSLEINKLASPLKVFSEYDNFKLYLNDVGILVTLSESSYSKIMLDDFSMYKGALTENYVANQFTANSISLYYWQKNQVAEIDFLLDTKNGIIPVEVNGADNITSKSLNYYISKYKPEYSIRISTKNFGFENNIKSVPLYACFCITKDL